MRLATGKKLLISRLPASPRAVWRVVPCDSDGWFNLVWLTSNYVINSPKRKGRHIKHTSMDMGHKGRSLIIFLLPFIGLFSLREGEWVSWWEISFMLHLLTWRFATLHGRIFCSPHSAAVDTELPMLRTRKNKSVYHHNIDLAWGLLRWSETSSRLGIYIRVGFVRRDKGSHLILDEWRKEKLRLFENYRLGPKQFRLSFDPKWDEIKFTLKMFFSCSTEWRRARPVFPFHSLPFCHNPFDDSSTRP